jgi:hypothetical protein
MLAETTQRTVSNVLTFLIHLQCRCLMALSVSASALRTFLVDRRKISGVSRLLYFYILYKILLVTEIKSMEMTRNFEAISN